MADGAAPGWTKDAGACFTRSLKLEMVRGTGFEPVSAPPVDQELTKDGTHHSTHAEILCSRVVKVWAFLSPELQQSIASIVEQYVQLSLGRPAGPGDQSTRE